MMVINETMGMSYITIVSQCDFETNSMDKAVMSAASFIGKLVSLSCFRVRKLNISKIEKLGG